MSPHTPGPPGAAGLHRGRFRTCMDHLALREGGPMYQPLSDGTLHLLAIDLPLACVLVAPLLLAANALRKESNPALIVPAVMLIVLGASSLCIALLETQPSTEAPRTGLVAAEVLEH